MSTNITQKSSNFKVLKENKDALLEAIKGLSGKEKEFDGHIRPFKGVAANNETEFVIPGQPYQYEFLQAKTAELALKSWGFKVSDDVEGNINGLEFDTDRLGDQHRVFEVIAPYVESGSQIQIEVWDTDNLVTYSFDEGQFHQRLQDIEETLPPSSRR